MWLGGQSLQTPALKDNHYQEAYASHRAEFYASILGG